MAAKSGKGGGGKFLGFLPRGKMAHEQNGKPRQHSSYFPSYEIVTRLQRHHAPTG